MIYIRALIGQSWYYLGTDKNNEPTFYPIRELANTIPTREGAAVLMAIVGKLPAFRNYALEIYTHEPPASSCSE